MKQQLIQALVSFYRLLLWLYPRRFYEEFGEEMTAVFHQTLITAPSNWHILAVSLRELRDWPMSCWREHQRSLGMDTTIIWINEHKRLWRTAVLPLLLIAITGPWSFDIITVTGEYTCSPSTIQLHATACGVPITITPFLSFMVSDFRNMALITGERDTWGLTFVALLLVLLLPLATTMILIWRGDQQRWHRFQLIVLSLAAGISFWGLSDFSGPHLALWGIWLYIALVVAMLVLERLTLVAATLPRVGPSDQGG